MGAQSLVLGKQFGEGFQYGKRKISAMSNEEFNAITPAKLAQNNAKELKEMIPSMQQSITDMRTFQSFIVQELIATVKQLPDDIFGKGGIISEGSLIDNIIEGKGGNALGQLTGQGNVDAIKELGKILDKGITLNLAGLGSDFNLFPKAFGDNENDQIVNPPPPSDLPPPPQSVVGNHPPFTGMTERQVEQKLTQDNVTRENIKILRDNTTDPILKQGTINWFRNNPAPRQLSAAELLKAK